MPSARRETHFRTCVGIDYVLAPNKSRTLGHYRCQLKKGSPAYIEGRLKLDTWEDKEGQKRSRMKVVAENVQFLGGRSGGDEASESSEAAPAAVATGTVAAAAAAAAPAPARRPAKAKVAVPADGEDPPF